MRDSFFIPIHKLDCKMKIKTKNLKQWKPINSGVPSIKKQSTIPRDGSWYVIAKLDYQGYYILPPMAIKWIPYHDDVTEIGRFITDSGAIYNNDDEILAYNYWATLQ